MFIIIYLDNILIYSSTRANYAKHVCLVLEALHKHKLYIKLEKCVFSKNHMEYLGFIIFKSGLAMDPS